MGLNRGQPICPTAHWLVAVQDVFTFKLISIQNMFKLIVNLLKFKALLGCIQDRWSNGVLPRQLLNAPHDEISNNKELE